MAGKQAGKTGPIIRFPFTGGQIPLRSALLERYPLNNPFAYAAIVEDEAGTTRKYFLDEVPLTLPEAGVYTRILDQLESELTIPRSEVDPKKYFAEQARRIVTKYGIKVAPIPWSKILYFAERDLVGFGILDALLKDPNIEDISVDGVGKPIFVYHRKYESLATNVTINGDADLDSLITRLAHMAGKHISTAFPILQGILPGRHRLMATFRREVSPYGSTLTIRKFREDPLTVVDLLNFKVLDHRMAAYIWLLMENKATVLVAGATGSGKTTLLNALLTLTRANTKLVTIEEVQEVNIPHFNWTALVSRESYGSSGESTGQVGLFDLVKAAMRMRPDIIVVGEVRGEEAYVLFQAISTGHGGSCLPPSERLLVSVDGMPTMTTMGELYDRQTRTGYTVYGKEAEIVTPGGELLVPSYDVGSNRMVWARVKRISRRKYRGNLLKFRVRGGNSATTTPDHPILSLRNGRLVRIPANQVRVGDLMPCTGEIPVQGDSKHQSSIDLIDEVARRGLGRNVTVKSVKDLLYSKTRGELASLLQVKARSIDDYRDRDYVPFSKYVMLKDQNRDRRHLAFRKSPHSLPALIPVDERLARLIGFYLAEGHANANQIGFTFNKSEAAFIGEVADDLASCFNLRASVRYSGQSAQIVAKDRLVSWFFREVLDAGSDSYSKRVPALIIASPLETVKAVLDAYFLGDGSAFIGRDGRASVQAVTASDELAYGVYYLMLMAGYVLTIGKDRRYGNWQLTVGGGENFRRFVAEFSLGARLRGHVFKGNPGLSEKVPIEYALSKSSNKLLLTKQGEGNRFVSRQVLDRLALPRPRGIFFAEVTTIEKEEHVGYVYDLFEVEGTHNFVHGFGLVTSNCTLHADDVESAIQRLTSKPMDVPESFIPFLDLVFTVRRISIPQAGGGFKAVRRIVSVDEVTAVKQYFNVFRWNPASDTHAVAQLRDSPKLARLARDLGLRVTDVVDELNRRSVVLRWLQEKGIRNYKELSLIFEDYLAHPQQIFENALRETGMTGMLEADVAQGFKL